MTDFNPRAVIGDNAPSVTAANAATTFRAVLIGLAGWLVGKGWLPQGLAEVLIPAVLAGAPLVWGYVKNHNTGKMIQAAIDAPAGRATP